MKDKYSKEYCKTIAFKYEYKIDFIKNNRNIYMFSYRRNYLNEICSHMKKLNNNNKRLIYRFIFSDNSCYIGLTYDFNKRKDNHLKYDKTSAVYIHMNKIKCNPTFELLTELIDVEEAIQMEIFWIERSINDGYNILNRINSSSIGGTKIIWTKEKCYEEALKYNTKKDLKKNNITVYNKIYKYRWMDEMFIHMSRPITYNQMWTTEKCYEEVLKYNTKKDFFIHSNSAYQYAKRHKFIKEITKNMN